MAKPNSRPTLIKYCKRALGWPVVEINVDDDQVEDRIDEALQFYQEYHDDAIEKVFLKHQITQDDVDNGKLANPVGITIAAGITSITKVFNISDAAGSSANMFNFDYQMRLNDLYNVNYSTGLLDYAMTRMHYEMWEFLADDDNKQFEFKRHRNSIIMHMDWDEVSVGDYLIFEAYRILDPSTYTDVYNDYYLKRYATALIKQQWGVNLSKFEGMVMPGGVTFNGRQIFEDAREELEKLTEEARLNWEMPIDFYTG
jgi:hypothetical protein